MIQGKVYPWRDRLEANKRQLLEWTPSSSRVLEFGCATGYMTRILRDERGCRVTGFECSAAAAEQASGFCEDLIVGDIEDASRWERLREPYDVVMLADVLEHLRDPAAVLRRCRALLKPDGRLLLSMPNVAHYTVRWNLLRGRFDYTESGLLDDSHLRFFTRRTLLAMVRDAGYQVEALAFSTQRSRLGWILHRLRLDAVARVLAAVACRLTPDAMAFQWVLQARALGAGAPAAAEEPRRARPLLEP
jgi:2-polyprenyl-3-methyl-5-hydroxy-6-metoxy-1,4-benzoquinol methylase